MSVFAICHITPGAHICRGVRKTLDEAFVFVAENIEAGAVPTISIPTEGVEWIVTDNLLVGRSWAIRFVSDGGS